MLTGGLPEDWVVDDKDKDATSSIDTITVDNNLLSEGIEKEVCRLSIFDRGQLVELSADCDVCWCDWRLCDYCW